MTTSSANLSVVPYLRLKFFPTDALMEYTNGEFIVTGQNATANIFASYPAKHLSVVNGFVDQVRLRANVTSFWRDVLIR